MKIYKKRLIAGVMALLLGCSTLFTASAADTAKNAKNLKDMVEELPELPEVVKNLEEDEIVTAEDVILTEGDSFEAENNLSGINYSMSKVKVTFGGAKNQKGQEFDSNVTGVYHAIYCVEPKSGNPVYKVTRKIIVNERKKETQGQQEKVGSKDEKKDNPDEEDSRQTGEVLTEIPEMPENAEDTVNVTDKENGVIFSVMPAMATRTMSRRSVSANLVTGEKLVYPSNLGNYSTNYFTVNGRVAYCLEAKEGTPSSGDYAANVFESNVNLQKVLYYGYGGPGDITDSFMPTFDWSLKYVFTHLAASYAYCGMDAFYGCKFEDIKSCGVWGFIEYLSSLSVPPTAAISLSPTETRAYEDGGIQRTTDYRFDGDSRNYITLNLPENVTYHSGGTTQTGRVTIYGGTRFYFSAPLSVTGTWNSGILTGQMGSQWKTLVVSTSAGKQDIGYGAFFDEENSTVSFRVKWMDLAKIKVMKADEATGVNLAGAVFGIYADKGCTNLITEMPATDSQGASEVQIPKTQERVYLKEITVPQGYKLNTAVFNVALTAGETTSVNITNQEQMGKITIRKSGDMLTSVDGTEGNLDFVYGSSGHSGAKFTIYAAENIYSQDKVTKIYNSGEVVLQLETGVDGNITTPELHLGTYRIVEQQAPHGLVIGKTTEERTQNVTLSYAGEMIEFASGEAAYTNNRPDISVKVVKKSADDDVTLEGAVFGLYAESDIPVQNGSIGVRKGTLIERAVSDMDGRVVFHADIPVGYRYSVREIQAPDLYCTSDEVYSFTYEYKDDTTYRYIFENEFRNKEVCGEIHINKIDMDSQNFTAQGNAKMVGARYGLYAAENIQNPNKKSGILYRKDGLVDQGKISEDGTLDFRNLYLGKYYVKELEPAEGYLLDETVYPVTVNYEGQNVKTIHRFVTVREKVKKQAFQMIKISENGEQTETEIIEGAGFKVFLVEDLIGVKNGKLKPSNGRTFSANDFIGYDYSKDKTASYFINGERVYVPELFTDSKGYLKSPELPYGEYVVFESTTPKNLQTINPFLVHITEDNREPQVWRVFDDRPLQFYFKIVKKDAQTQENVLDNGASYRIFDLESEEYVEMLVRYPKKEKISVFQTNEEGYLLTPEPLKYGSYRVEEVHAPDSYVITGNEKSLTEDGREIPLNEVNAGGSYANAHRDCIVTTVEAGTAHQVEEETGNFIVAVEQSNDEAVGSLTLNKRGEKLKEAVKIEDKMFSKVKNRMTSFINAVSETVTGEPVMEQSIGYEFKYGQEGLEGVEFSVYAGETIYTPDRQTDAEGNRIVKYHENDLVSTLVTDTEGKAVLNNLPIGKYYLAERKAGEGFVLDTDRKEFEIKYNGQESAVDFVTMNLTNERQHISVEILKEDAVTGKVLEGVVFGLYAEETIKNTAGEVLVEKDELIEAGRTDAEGKMAFKADLPHGKYYVKELEHKRGYLPNDEVYHLEAAYSDSSVKVIELVCKIENQPTVTELTKTDLTGGQEIEGARLQILKEGEVIEEWVSGKEPHIVYALEPGEYVLHEELAPTEQGYVRAEDVTFVVEETGEVQKVEMQDDHTKTVVSKSDITDGKEIQGAVLQIIDGEGKVLEEWISGEEHLIEYLPVGSYTLHEESAIDGYVVADDVEFDVLETGEVQKVEMLDERTMGILRIKKTDGETEEPLEGVEFTLYEKESEEAVATLVTDKDGNAESIQLPIGIYGDGVLKEITTYVLKETKALEGYEESEEEWEIIFEYQDDKTPIIEVSKDIQNKKIPVEEVANVAKTGDKADLVLPVLGILAGIVCVIGVVSRKKKLK